MKIALVGLEGRTQLFRTPLWTPVFLPSLAAVLRAAGHAVWVLERGRLNAEKGGLPFSERLGACLRASGADAVVFDVRAESWPALGPAARSAREALPAAVLLAGGRHATLCPEESLRHCPALEAAVIGEAEIVIERYAGGTPLDELPSVAIRRGDRVAVNAEPAPVVEMDALPMPAWDLLDMAYYTAPTPRVIPCRVLRTATIETSRGCGGGCVFCAEGRFHDRRHRAHSPSYVSETVEKLQRDYAVEAVYFSDENFGADAGRVGRLCEEFLSRGLDSRIRWCAQIRADAVSPELLAFMRRAGCMQLEFGIESGSARLLERMGKGTTVERNEAALRMTREAGIRSLAYVMCGLPWETAEDARRTGEFLERANPDIVRLNLFAILPGTPVARTLAAEGLLPADYWVKRGLVTTADPATAGAAAMSPTEIALTARRLYRRHVLPRLLSDALAGNAPLRLARSLNMPAVLPFLLKRLLA